MVSDGGHLEEAGLQILLHDRWLRLEKGGTRIMSTVLAKAIAPATGAVLGFLYYKFIGCATGACPITSNPVISTLYGALIGLALSFGK